MTRLRRLAGLIVRALSGALPHALYEYIFITRPIRRREVEQDAQRSHALSLVTRNRDLLNIHVGRRCFILCNGPSVKSQDIRPLKGEHVFSVSNGYHHPDYAYIQPAYHCVPQLTCDTLSQADAIAWFDEMDAKIGSAQLFLNWTEEALIQRNSLFPGRDIRYVAFSGSHTDYDPLAKPDISREIPGVQSVPIMCLMMAMYMGFSRIYLLGTDHDLFRTGEYKYFYEPTVLRGKDPSADRDGKLIGKWHDEFAALASLWAQYRSIRKIAEHHGIEIFNATAGGELDEFRRVSFESLFKGS